MDEFFTLYVHHGEHYSENPKEYVGGDVGVVDDCDPNKLYKVEIESICKDFGFTSISRLWYKMPGDKKEGRMFNLINDDHDEIFMTILVRSHGQIHVYVEHPVNKSILINGGNGVTLDLVVEPEDVEPLDVSDPDGYTSSEPKPAYDRYYNGQGYFCSSDSNDDDEFYDGDDDFHSHQYFYEGDRDDRDGRDGGVNDEGGWDGSHDKSGIGAADGNLDGKGLDPTNVDGKQSD